MTDFEEIFRQHREFIYRYLLGLCRDADLAEELTQETFFKAYINLPKLRQEKALAVWLCQIAKNSFFSWYNAQKRQVPLGENDEETQAGPEQAYLQKELTHAALRALDALEEPYKKVLILSVYGELSLKDISRMFGKSESWARVTFHRGKQKLLERMEKEYGA